MKRGLVFSIIAVMLLNLLFGLALFQTRSSFGLEVSKKVVYTWDDVREDLFVITGLNAFKEEKNLSIYDKLPAEVTVSEALDSYFDFIRDYYKEENLEITLLDSGGIPITDYDCFGRIDSDGDGDCSDEDVYYKIVPFNITYGYPDWTKRQLEITCRKPDPCDFSPVQKIELEFNLTSVNFSCYPSIWNNCTNSDIQWNQFDKVFGEGACTGGEDCLKRPYNLTIRDSKGEVYKCKGSYGDDVGQRRNVNCPEEVWNWYDSSEATLTIKSNPCWVKLKFGDDGHFMIEGTQPQGGDSCNFSMDTFVFLEFNTTDFQFNLPSQLRVRDLGWNSSKTGKI